MKSACVFILFVATSCLCTFAADLGCRDEAGNLVEWYYLYKLPKSHPDDRHRQPSDGLDYLYLTSKSTLKWSPGSVKIDSEDSVPGRTMAEVYARQSSVASVLYNDEPPTDKVDMYCGHTKGVMASDVKSGFWLVHSVPHYPPDLSSNHYGYPTTGHIYGQSFLCITMTASQVNKAAKQLLYNEPHIYSHSIPESLKDLLPNMYRAVQNDTVKTAPFWNQLTLQSEQGTMFQSFAKTRRFQKDLYEDWLAPALNTNLDVETWRHGPGNLPSNCSLRNTVQNIKSLEVPEISFEFATLKDHSKWAVSDAASNWICVGDINRQEHQKQRGGGTVCQRNVQVWRAYRKLIKEIEGCPKH